MPWDPKTYGAVCAGLRDAALRGEFVPCRWNAGVVPNGDGYRFFGCGWGVVGWITAVMKDGTAWAQDKLPVGCNQWHVNRVLVLAGLTPFEVKQMEPDKTMAYFDRELIRFYDDRYADWGAFIEKSLELAEFFIDVLSRVPILGEEPVKYQPFAVMAAFMGPDLPPLSHLHFGIDETKTIESMQFAELA